MPRAVLHTVGDVLAWFELRDQGCSAVARTERARQRKLFALRLGKAALADCQPVDLLDHIDAMPNVRSRWTRRRIRAALEKPFNEACRLGLIARNPFAGVRLPEGPRGRDWTPAEYQAVLRSSPPYLRRLVVFLRFSGARPGEGRRLTWASIVAGVAVLDDHKTAHIGAGPRRIYLGSVVLRLLCWIRQHEPHKQYVFVNGFNRPWSTQALDKHFRAVRKRAGLDASVKLHGARHTFATGAVVNGVSVATLAELLGHRSLATTEIYLHMVNQRDHLRKAVEQATKRSA